VPVWSVKVSVHNPARGVDGPCASAAAAAADLAIEIELIVLKLSEKSIPIWGFLP